MAWFDLFYFCREVWTQVLALFLEASFSWGLGTAVGSVFITLLSVPVYSLCALAQQIIFYTASECLPTLSSPNSTKLAEPECALPYGDYCYKSLATLLGLVGRIAYDTLADGVTGDGGRGGFIFWQSSVWVLTNFFLPQPHFTPDFQPWRFTFFSVDTFQPLRA